MVMYEQMDKFWEKFFIWTWAKSGEDISWSEWEYSKNS